MDIEDESSIICFLFVQYIIPVIDLLGKDLGYQNSNEPSWVPPGGLEIPELFFFGVCITKCHLLHVCWQGKGIIFAAKS